MNTETQQSQTQSSNPFAVATAGPSTMDIATTRSATEVQAAMVVAKKYPRDQALAFERIMMACKRPTLAESAVYTYPRGSTTVEGPSIRLAEAIAQNWGNIDFGIVELAQESGESTVLAYCHDLETNTRQTKTFQVKHERHLKGGDVVKLSDPRDIYEMVANQGARRVRACILGVIPGDVTEEAVAECSRTMAAILKNRKLEDVVSEMVVHFSGLDSRINQAVLEGYLKHKLSATTVAEVVKLRKIYKTISDGHDRAESFFEFTQVNINVEARPVRKSKAAAAATQAAAATATATAPAQPDPMPDTAAAAEAPAAEATANPGAAPLAPPSTTAEGLVKTILHGLDTAGCTEEQAMEVFRARGLANQSHVRLAQLATTKLQMICTSFPALVAEIQAKTAAQ